METIMFGLLLICQMLGAIDANTYQCYYKTSYYSYTYKYCYHGCCYSVYNSYGDPCCYSPQTTTPSWDWYYTTRYPYRNYFNYLNQGTISSGAVFGIVIGSIVALGIFITVIICVILRSRQTNQNRTATTAQPSMTYYPGNTAGYLYPAYGGNMAGTVILAPTPGSIDNRGYTTMMSPSPGGIIYPGSNTTGMTTGGYPTATHSSPTGPATDATAFSGYNLESTTTGGANCGVTPLGNSNDVSPPDYSAAVANK